MYARTIEKLISEGLIQSGELAAACTDNNQTAAMWFGAIGAAIAASKAKSYILSANSSEIKLFDIDRATAAYLGTYIAIPRANINKVQCGKGLGAYSINIFTTDGTKKLLANNKFKSGFEQKETLTSLDELFKMYYGK